jgi:hypothetical protein
LLLLLLLLKSGLIETSLEVFTSVLQTFDVAAQPEIKKIKK